MFVVYGVIRSDQPQDTVLHANDVSLHQPRNTDTRFFWLQVGPTFCGSPDEALLEEAGFSGASLFYAGLSFREWGAYGDDLRRSGCCGDKWNTL
jgi:hypothetical protein